MKLRLRSPWPWIVAASQTALAYILLRYSFVQERLHYVGRHEFDPGYVPLGKVLVVWMNAPVYIATFWTSFFWANEPWEYSKLPGMFVFWLLISSMVVLPRRRQLQSRWWYFAAAVCLLGLAIWGFSDVLRSPYYWVNRPQSYIAGRAIMDCAIPAWLLFTAVYCFTQFGKRPEPR